MKCKKCGAIISDTSKFCDQCGWKVVKERRCPECGVPLREGIKFCPECGTLISGRKSSGEASNVPLDDIEQNILSETQREIGKTKTVQKKVREQSAARRPVPAPEQRRRENPAPVRKKVYREWEEDEDEDDDDEEEGEHSIMTIMSVVVGFLIFAVAAFLIFSMIRKEPAEDNGNSNNTENVGDDNRVEEPNGEGAGEPESEPDMGVDIEPEEPEQSAGTLSIVTDVRVRDYPSTESGKVIKVAKAGEVYEYLGPAEDDSWCMIKLEDGSTAYIAKDYVSID